MRRCVRAIALALLLWSASVALSDWGQGSRNAAAAISIVSPPAETALPVGQAVEVRCRVRSGIDSAYLSLSGISAGVIAIPSGDSLVFTWSPASEGVACIAVQALDARSLPVGAAERCLQVLPVGARIRLGELPR